MDDLFDYTELKGYAKENGLHLAEMESLLYDRCPHFDHCSAVDCPLDWLQGHRGEEEEERCFTKRQTRSRIIEEARAEGLKFPPLPRGGLTYRETVFDKRSADRKARYEALSPEEKEAFAERQQRGLEALRAARARRAGAGTEKECSTGKDSPESSSKTTPSFTDLQPKLGEDRR